MNTPTTSDPGRLAAPCAPRTDDHLALRPVAIDQVAITGGFWGQWQHRNRDVTTPHALTWLERDGAMDNLRRLFAQDGGPERRGMLFSDSDLYKALEGIAWDLGREASPELEAIVDDAAHVLEQAQLDDGYLNSWVQAGMAERYADLTHGHEMYCAGHLIQAAVAHARTTGRESLLQVARRLADNLVREFGDRRRVDVDGHPEIETALVELYRHTGERSYLDLAQQFVDVRGYGVIGKGTFGSAYFQDDVPVREQDSVVGHSVRALYLMAGFVDLYLETGERALLEAAERQWASMVGEKTYITGAVGSRFEGEAFGDPFELPPDLIYGETCAGIASVMATWRLLLATGEGKYADLIERTMHNLFAASTNTAGDGFFYVNPVQRRRPWDAAPVDGKPLRSDAPGTRPAWFDCACCPPNIIRTVASLSTYLATVDDSGVQVHLYAPATMTLPMGSGQVRATVETDYPFDGTVTVRIEESTEQPWTLSLRIPAWSRGATIEVAGESRDATADGKGYVRVDRTWAAGDVVRLVLPMPVRLTVAHPAVDAVRGSVAIERGPVTYCLESPDQPEGVSLDSVELVAGGALRVTSRDDVLGGALVIEADGLVRDDSTWVGTPGWASLGEEPEASARPVTLTAVPYYLWANRGPSAMRVWVPLARS
ncbi:glycoside hydrolase family 127 protein [Cellulomonas sp. KRMCY2]|uniref:glycoside hydrolase family 127 protein n=1 Tax=Cellulomonas sp. KRMCY2 TaxID=1304865 RepID=UPI00045E9B72|nr:beta-L-arabinofuranosidase domain-containing protein [Cellulomonas sp. KRMCY2]